MELRWEKFSMIILTALYENCGVGKKMKEDCYAIVTFFEVLYSFPFVASFFPKILNHETQKYYY